MTRLPERLVLLGSPVGKSLSPVFQRAALAAAGIEVPYDAIDVAPENLAAVIQEIRSLNMAGNVTRPHKIAFHDACDELTPIARRVGAVNTFWLDGDCLHGDNTDVEGFDVTARTLLGEVADELRVVLLGSGGAASAVLAAIERWPGASVTIIARNPDHARRLAQRYRDVARVETDARRAAERARLIVNATPLGQHDDQHPLDVASVPAEAAAIDLVYRRGETPWIKALRARGIPAVDGMPMLLEQGAIAFRRWFGREPDRDAMRRSVE